jgi:hypothetical protein
MPGLLRGMVRTAAVAGTATAVSNRVSRRQANRWAAEEPAPAAPAPAPAAPAAGGQETVVEQLKDLASLKEQGVLTEEEFATQKARILAA